MASLTTEPGLASGSHQLEHAERERCQGQHGDQKEDNSVASFHALKMRTFRLKNLRKKNERTEAANAGPSLRMLYSFFCL